MNSGIIEKFKISSSVVVITGGAGLLGRQHAAAVIDGGGIPVLLDISGSALRAAMEQLGIADGFAVDITKSDEVESVAEALIKKYGHIDALINNAANNPKVEGDAKNMKPIRFENYPVDMWLDDISVGLTGALICSQVFGGYMAKSRRGVILNISSDLGVIAPDQRIYRKVGLPDDEQTVKPVTYSVVKHGLIGLTKYLATYYADKNVRANALCPAGVYNGQDDDFVARLTNLIPMGRMASIDEYKGAVLFLLSDASSYMTGSVVIMDGGRTCW